MAGILKEVAILRPLYIGIVENGEHLYVDGDYAKDRFGNRYIAVWDDIEDEGKHIGWLPENEAPPELLKGKKGTASKKKQSEKSQELYKEFENKELPF